MRIYKRRAGSLNKEQSGDKALSDEYGIGAAARIGLEMGRDMQRRAVLRSWQDHAANLEKALDEANQRAKRKQIALEIKAAEVEYKEECLKALSSRLDAAEQKYEDLRLRFNKNLEYYNRISAEAATVSAKLAAAEQAVQAHDRCRA